MGLSSDLIAQFVKVTNDTKKTKKDVVLYGTIRNYNDTKYVQLDGSDLLTPYDASTDAKDGDRVLVTIKNHTVTATGNMTSPSASVGTVNQVKDDLNGKFETLKAETITTEELAATNAKIEELESKQITTEELDAKYATIENLSATNAAIQQLDVDKIDANEVEAKYANIKFANVDFAQIEKAIFKEFYAQSGIIKDAVVDNEQITGELVGVTIKGDLIEGETVVANKLLIRGVDGLYYALNTNGEKYDFEQTDYNSINGSIITAKSITATKIAVKDLVAFGATIGGFHITNDSIYSGVKGSIDNPLQGLYMDNEGQLYIGDNENYLKYYKDEKGNYKLDISASSMMFGIQKQTIDKLTSENADLKEKLDRYEKYFTFTENGFGITDAQGQNTAELVIDSGIIAFKKNGEQYGWWDGINFHTGNVIVDVNERAQFGDFAFIPRSDGSLTFLKVGGD